MAHGPDQVLTALALTLEQQIGRGFGVPPASHQRPCPTFGHTGAGGSSAFADPDHRVAFGCAMTLMLLRPEPANVARRSASTEWYG